MKRIAHALNRFKSRAVQKVLTPGYVRKVGTAIELGGGPGPGTGYSTREKEAFIIEAIPLPRL